MNRPDARSDATATTTAKAADVFVLGAMAVVAMAVTAALTVQFGAATWIAGVTGCTLFAALVSLHALRAGAKQAPAARRAPAGGRKGRAAPAVAAQPTVPAFDPGDETAAAMPPSEAASPSYPSQGFEDAVPAGAHPDAVFAELATRHRATGQSAPEYPPPFAEAADPFAPPPLQGLDVQPSGDSGRRPAVAAPPSAPTSDPMQDYWSFAPGAPRFDGPGLPDPEPAYGGPSATVADVPVTVAADPAAAAPQPPPVPERSQAASPRQEDVEVIQGLIKKLADEVNAAEMGEPGAKSKRGNPGAIEPGGLQAGDPALPAPPLAAARPTPRGPEETVEASLSALRVTASTMRAAGAAHKSEEASALAAASARSRFAGAAVPTPPPLPDGQPSGEPEGRAAALSEAIAMGRMDVLLEPIMGLGDQQAQHYEVTLRLRAGNGDTLETSRNGGDLNGSRVLALLDAARMARTSAIAARLGERGKQGSVFSSYNGSSLADREFLADVEAQMRSRPATAGQLVLTFSQADVRDFESPEWSALADLNRLGFRFALSEVTDLDLDFEALVTAGFGFAKLEADVFLEGLRAPSGLVPAADICRYLAGLGLTLIVEGIDNDMKLARIFGFGVLLGQGQLFGVPRPVKADVVAGQRHAAA